MAEHKPENQRDARGVVEVVEAIIDDIRDLVGAHVDALREDTSARFANLGTAIASTLLAFSITVVTALLAGIALALTLVAVGLPAWAAFWIVAACAAVAGIALIRRVRRKARETGMMASKAVDSVKNDIAWIADHTDTAEEEASP
jgi:putative superfamily III holin-X